MPTDELRQLRKTLMRLRSANDEPEQKPEQKVVSSNGKG